MVKKQNYNIKYINNPVNKNIRIHPKLSGISTNHSIGLNDNGISIITCTNRPNYISNILENYNRQNIPEKELILVLNNNKMSLEKIKDMVKYHKNIKVFQLDEKISLGNCLNYAINKSNFDIVSKFDDDDYYDTDYMKNSITAFNYTDAQVIGKSTTYVYFEKSKILALRNLNKENRYVFRLEGPTLIMKKDVLKKVRFRDKNLGEDVQFCKDCIKNKINLFSTSKSDYIYVRHNEGKEHTWKISDQYYLKLCKIIGRVDNYKNCIAMLENSTSIPLTF